MSVGNVDGRIVGDIDGNTVGDNVGGGDVGFNDGELVGKAEGLSLIRYEG